MDKNKIDYIDTTLDYYINGANPDIIPKDNNNDKNIDFFIDLIAYSKIDEMRELLEKDKDEKKILKLIDKDSDSLLHFSVHANNYEITKLLLKYGADPNFRNNNGQSPIYRIVFASDEKLIGLLMEYGLQIDIQDKNGNTPLHIAVLEKKYSMVRSLLNYGANPVIRNNDKFLAIDFAINKINDTYISDKELLFIFEEYIK